MPAWLLQSNPPKLAERLTTPMAWTLKQLGIPFCGFQVLRGEAEGGVVDQSNYSIDLDEVGEVPESGFLYGSVRALRLALSDTRWPTKLAFDAQRFDFRAWRDELGDLLWNASAKVMPFGEALSSWRSGTFHLRPTADLKAFKGICCARAELEQHLIQSQASMPDPATLVALSPVHLPTREWRCVVVGGEVVAAGGYMINGEVRPSEESAPVRVWEQARVICRTWIPSPFCTLDLAEDETGRLRLLEFNCLHASGFYRLDRQAIALAVENHWHE